jgi:hypothetical protein
VWPANDGLGVHLGDRILARSVSRGPLTCAGGGAPVGIESSAPGTVRLVAASRTNVQAAAYVADNGPMKLTRTAHRVLLAAVILTLPTFAACGGDDGNGVAQEQLVQERIQQERREAGRIARQDERLRRLESELREERRSEASPSPPATEEGDPPPTDPGGESPVYESSESWPPATNAWTVVLASAATRTDAEAVARRASAAGLPQAGVLLSDNHSSLHRGYWVAYTGVLERSVANGRANEAHAAGFADAYARFVSAP